jgi:hypothetical protein
MARRGGLGSARGSKAGGKLLAAIVVMGQLIGSPSAVFAQAACAKTEFEEVVDGAAAALRDLNNKNRPEFQDKLRHLKDKRGWDNDQFLIEAAPLVKDDQIDVFDDKTNDLLAKISSMGQEGATAKTPDCVMLAELKGHMATLVETQTAKWAYMFKKLDDELAK